MKTEQTKENSLKYKKTLSHDRSDYAGENSTSVFPSYIRDSCREGLQAAQDDRAASRQVDAHDPQRVARAQGQSAAASSKATFCRRLGIFRRKLGGSSGLL